jgi:hypothetical protein
MNVVGAGAARIPGVFWWACVDASAMVGRRATQLLLTAGMGNVQAEPRRMWILDCVIEQSLR